ncbi:MAG TPA: tail fiber domain-containing protein [Polyangia bacterium]
MAIILGSHARAHAAAPALLPVQGLLTDGAGAPLDGAHDLKFALFDAASVGNLLFTQSDAGVQIDRGRFIIYLGQGGTALDLALFRDHAALWLEVTIDGTQVVQPRFRLATVPYASFAQFCGDAATVGGNGATAFAASGHSHAWNQITGIPASLLDGDQDTLATLVCGAGQAVKWGGSAWGCGDFAAASHLHPWSQLTGVPPNLEDLALLACSLDQVPKWNGTGWACGADADSGGDITGVTAGTGLSGGGQAGSVTVSLDRAYTDGLYWKLGGNGGTTAGTHFIGTTDGQALELKVNSARMLRLEPGTNSITGVAQNSVTAGVAMATIAGGGMASAPNRVTDDGGFVAGGRGNQAGDNAGTTVDKAFATVGGGAGNTASGLLATIPGGSQNVAAGDYSFAAGNRAKANSAGCFVWSDSQASDVTCANPDRWVARASGGVYFYTNSALSAGSYLAAGSGTWSSVSDREQKSGIVATDPEQVLAALEQVPVSTWSYKTEPGGVRHMGPMAQDFHGAFGLGDSERHIAQIDADGVALAAIQGLLRVTRRQDARLAALGSENATLAEQNAAFARRLERLESAAGSGPASGGGWLWGALGVGAMGVLVVRRGRRSTSSKHEEGGR